MGHFTWVLRQSLFGALVGLALLSACTNTELALDRNEAANPRAATAPLPALARLSSSADAPPTAAPVPEHDMPAGMKMDGNAMGPMDPHASQHAEHAGMLMGEASKHEATAAPAKAAHWTCTMHPSVDLPKPGKCPICGMKLVPKADGAGDGGAK